MDLRGIVVCVDCCDLLAITLPRNMRHMSECLIVTAPHDTTTQEFVETIPNTKCFVTDAFYRYGAHFNKGMAIEEGFDVLGRHGRILIHDADIVFPKYMPLLDFTIGNLHSPNRHMLEDVSKFTDKLNWQNLPISKDRGLWGYYQLFDAGDPHLIDKRPWYDVTFTHAGGSDAHFESMWPKQNRKRITTFKVLHLGARNQNWFGIKNSNKTQLQTKLHQANGWGSGGFPGRPIGTIKDRICIPEYPPSTFTWNQSKPPEIEDQK